MADGQDFPQEREQYDLSQIGSWSFPFPWFPQGGGEITVLISRGYFPVTTIWFSIAAVFWHTIAASWVIFQVFGSDIVDSCALVDFQALHCLRHFFLSIFCSHFLAVYFHFILCSLQ